MNVQHSVKAHVQMDASQNAQMVVVKGVTVQHVNYNVQGDVQINVEHLLSVESNVKILVLPTVYLLAKVHVVHQQTVEHNALVRVVQAPVVKLDVVIVVLLLVAVTALVVGAVHLVEILVIEIA